MSKNKSDSSQMQSINDGLAKNGKHGTMRMRRPCGKFLQSTGIGFGAKLSLRENRPAGSTVSNKLGSMKPGWQKHIDGGNDKSSKRSRKVGVCAAGGKAMASSRAEDWAPDQELPRNQLVGTIFD